MALYRSCKSLVWLGLFLALAYTGVLAAEYVGRQACTSCHETQYQLWTNSHHDLAMQAANDQTVLGDFNNAKFTYFGVTSTFFKKTGKFSVRTDGPDGKLADYEIKYTFGVHPLQQYLIEFPGGRLQALSIAWDTRPKSEGGQRWFHLYPDEKIAHNDPLHWTGPNQNWNHMCAGCHSTKLRKNFDPQASRYNTTWSEIDVSCEACHGPGSDHVGWAQSTHDFKQYPNKELPVRLNEPGIWQIDNQTGLAKRTPALNSATQVETCGRCHSRRATAHSEHVHGQPLMDTHYPAALREELYYADGQIDDEVYVYGSFLQSKMYRKGVTCSNCHEPHSLKLKAAGNALCATCHLPTKFDTPKHHFHKVGEEAAQCISCHMPSRNYMVVDPRRDHSFRIPRPDLSIALGTPNACTQCHTERTNKWAAGSVTKWYGTKRGQETHYGEAIYAGRQGAVNAERLLIALAKDRTQPAIARATAGSLMRGYISPVTVPVLSALLHDPDPLVRVSALNTVDALPPQNKLPLAQHLLTDPVRVVRIEAARVLADTRSLLPAGERGALENTIGEYIETLKENADRPETHANLGNLLIRLGRLKEAEAAYKKAIHIDANFVPAYVNLADLYRAQNRDDAGKELILQAIKRQPENGSLRHAYGLLLVREKRLTEAVGALKQAIDLEPNNTRYRYVYAIALESTGRLDQALQILDAAHARRPADRNVLYALISFHERTGNVQAAAKFAETLVEVSPWDQNARALRKRLVSLLPPDP